MQAQDTRKQDTAQGSRSPQVILIRPERRVIAPIDWLGVVAKAAEAQAETLRAALGVG